MGKVKRITFIVEERNVLNGDKVVWTPCFVRVVPVESVLSISEVIDVLHQLFVLSSHRVIVKSELL